MLYKVLVVLHVLGATIWTGGHLILATAILPKAMRARDPEIIRGFEAAYGKVGSHALLLQIVTGVWLAASYMSGFGEGLRAGAQVPLLIVAKLALLFATAAVAVRAKKIVRNLSPETVPSMARHIITATLLSVLFVVVGVGVRTGGLW